MSASALSPSAPIMAYVILSGVIFAIGAFGVVVRRSPLHILMCVELVWNAANLALLAFARQHGNADGHVFAFVVITVAAAEVGIGLALIVLLFRRRRNVDVDEARALQG